MGLSRLMARIRRPEPMPTPYLQDPDIHTALAPQYQPPPRPAQRQPRPRTEPDLPAYTPEDKPTTSGIHSLPTAILHQILLLTLDPKATPTRFAFDDEIERIHRLHAVFLLRGVDKRFFLLCTSLLRTHFTPIYNSLLTSPSEHPGARERALLDRFVALRIGQDLRRAESTLTEDTGEERDILRLQPAARIEDELLYLPRHLVVPKPPTLVLQEFPIPHSGVSVRLTPGWAQVYALLPRRAMVVEVRRGSVEETIGNIQTGLELVRAGVVAWGSRVA